MDKKKVIFVCLHNSARSQMAEGLLRHLYGECYEVFSAGSAPTRVHPLTIKAMEDMGIDISGHRAKGLDEFSGSSFDLAVTVCGPETTCPVIPGARTSVHKEFDDPSGSSEISTFIRVRDEIAAWIRDRFKDPSAMNRKDTGSAGTGTRHA